MKRTLVSKTSTLQRVLYVIKVCSSTDLFYPGTVHNVWEDQKSYNQVASSRAVNKALSDVISIYVCIPAKGTWVNMAIRHN